MNKIKKVNQNKYITNFEGDRELNTRLGYRLVDIVCISNTLTTNNLWVLMREFFDSNELEINMYDGSICEYEDYFEFTIEIDEDDIKEFNKLWKQFKKEVL